MKKLTIEEYVCALEKMKKSPRDRVGILGELGVTGIGLTAGVAASGSIAAATGAATIAGSTTLASILGGVFVTTTPVGWVVGSAIAGGTLAYSAGKLIRSGSRCDKFKEINIYELEKRISAMRNEAKTAPQQNDKMAKVITSIQYLVSNSHMKQEKSTQILEAIEKKALSVEEAFDLLQAIINEKTRR